MSVSLWRRRAGPDIVEADLCIVGAGVCGLSCALEAEARGQRVVVIERADVAAGASGRNAGYLMRGVAESYAAAAGAIGREAARLAWRWSEENLEILRSDGAADLPSFRVAPSCLLALNDADAEDLERSAAMLREDGFGVEFPWQTDDAIFASGRVRAALNNPHDAAVNPVELCRMLAGKLRGRIITGQEVHAITDDGAGARAVRIRSADVEARAGRALVCINAWAPTLLPQLASLITPNRGQMLAARPHGGGGGALPLAASYYANRGADYLRQTPDGLIVAGGQRARFAEAERTADDVPTEPVQAAIERFARDLLGCDLEILARWAGTMGFSPDGLPVIGPVPRSGRTTPPTNRPGSPVASCADPSGRIWFCGGFTGHGMSLARRAAREAVEAMLGGRSPAFGFDRFLPAGGREAGADRVS